MCLREHGVVLLGAIARASLWSTTGRTNVCTDRRQSGVIFCREQPEQLQLQGSSTVRDHDDRLGHRGHAGRRDPRRSADVPRSDVRYPVAVLRTPAPLAYQCGDLRVRRLCLICHQLLRCPAYLSRAAVLQYPRGVHLLGVAGRHRAGRLTLPMGITSGKEYAELEWPIDVLITLVWVAYAISFFGTIAKRKTPHIYVANWFFGAFILTVALLHLVNSAEIPVTFWKSYSAYAGVPGCDGAVVVRTQRGRIFPDRRLPRDDVLLRAEAGWPADLQLPALGGAFLGADLHLHVGRASPFALYGAARLGAVARNGVLVDSAGALVGRHDQRHHDAVGSVA